MYEQQTRPQVTPLRSLHWEIDVMYEQLLARILHERAVAGRLIGHPMVPMFSMRHWTVFCPIRAQTVPFRHTSPTPIVYPRAGVALLRG